jgi:hypothetical protein
MFHLGFAGLWETDFGTLQLQVHGSRVTGEYGSRGGHVEGIVCGSILRGTWRQLAEGGFGSSWGDVNLVLGGDGRSFTGTWTYRDDHAPGGGSWNGKRLVESAKNVVQSVGR